MVSSPEVVAPETGATAWAVRAEAFKARKFWRATSAVRGEPSWKRTFGRRVTVQAVMSALGMTEAARWGRMEPSAATAVRVSKTALAYVRPVLSKWEAAGRKPSMSELMAM